MVENRYAGKKIAPSVTALNLYLLLLDEDKASLCRPLLLRTEIDGPGRRILILLFVFRSEEPACL